MKETENHIETEMNIALSIQNGSVIDFETTGSPHKDRDAEIVTLGYFSQNRVAVLQRKTKDKKPFYDEVAKKIIELPKPFYSYNARFEREIIESELGIKLSFSSFTDLMDRWRLKAEGKDLKWPKLDELIEEPDDYFGEIKVNARDIPGLWKAYLSGGTQTLLKMIMNHCLSDILREVVLLVMYEPNHS